MHNGTSVVPGDILLTSFSILFARYKGNLEAAVRGAKVLDSLKGNKHRNIQRVKQVSNYFLVRFGNLCKPCNFGFKSVNALAVQRTAVETLW